MNKEFDYISTNLITQANITLADVIIEKLMQSDLDQRERWLTNKQLVVRGYPELIDPKKKFIEYK